MQAIAENIWLQRHPLSLLGMKLGRNVVPIRLASGKVIVHSTAPFSQNDVDAIKQLGPVSWILDATNFHDTYSVEGTEAFPDTTYLAPPGFPLGDRLEFTSLENPPPEWEEEIELITIGGMPKINETVFYHRPSRTLIVADLLFHLSQDTDWWTRTGLRLLSGIREFPGNSRLFRAMIQDKEAFEQSLQEILALDFKRIVVAHGVPITEEPKDALVSVFRSHGFAL